MKRIFILAQFLIFFASASLAQSVAINNNGTQAAGSSILDVSSTTKGFLLPRMTAAQRLAITSPATGLQVFQTDAVANNPLGFYFFNGTAWVLFNAGAGNNTNSWTLDGNSNTNSATHFVGTSNLVDLKFATNNAGRMIVKSTGEIGIGTNNPAGILGLSRGSINTNQPVLRMDDGSTTATSPSVLLFNLGSNTLIDASTLGTGTMMRLNRDGAGGSGEGLQVNNKGTGIAINGQGTDGIAVKGFSNNSFGGFFQSTTRSGLRVIGETGADITTSGSGDGIILAMNSVKNSVQSIQGINVNMSSTGTAPVIGVDVLARSNTNGTQVVGIVSNPSGGANSSVACFIGTGDMAISGDYLFTSDRKLKKNITPMDSMLDKIMRLAPSNYLYRTDDFKMNLSKKKQHGLIAQELQTVFPELVSPITIPAKYDENKNLIAEETSYLAVSYTGLIPILIKGVQEQEHKIQTLQTENAELKKDLATIKAKLGL